MACFLYDQCWSDKHFYYLYYKKDDMPDKGSKKLRNVTILWNLVEYFANKNCFVFVLSNCMFVWVIFIFGMVGLGYFTQHKYDLLISSWWVVICNFSKFALLFTFTLNFI